MHNILVVDDELSIRESFSLILEGKHKVLLAASGEAALKAITSQKVDMVYLDVRMPGLNGLETLKRIKEIDPSLEVIMVTAVNEIQKASEAVKLGARDYVVKPFDVAKILKLTEQILIKKNILNEGLSAAKSASRKHPELIGQSDKIIEIIDSIENLKNNNKRVLILGEAGTEKELLAELIHNKTKGSKVPFNKLSLSQRMSPTEISILLFGQEKGASTIELSAKSGLLEQAKGGTLFIDNLECLPAEILKVLVSQQFSRIGSTVFIPIEAQIIGGSSTDLATTNKPVFDFFAEILIDVPPLRNRISDIPLLVKHFFEKYSDRYGKEVKITNAVLDALTSYPWPGNITQLKSLIEKTFLAHQSQEIVLDDLPIDILLKTSESIGNTYISTFEKQYVRNVFEKNKKDKEKTSVFLGISPQVLETKI